MQSVEISQLYNFSPPPATDQKSPQPAVTVQSPHAASEPSSNDRPRRYRYTPVQDTNSRIFPQEECPPSPTSQAESRKSPEPDTLAAMPAGVKTSTDPTPPDPLKSHREANLLTTILTPDQRRFHQSLRPSSPRIGVRTQARPPGQPRPPVLQKRARQNDIKPRGNPAASVKPRVSVTASLPVKFSYTHADAQRDLKTLSEADGLLRPAIKFNNRRLPEAQLENMKQIGEDIQALMKTIRETDLPCMTAEKFRRKANSLGGLVSSHLAQIGRNHVRETPPRPDVRKPLPKTEGIKAQEIRHAIWREQSVIYQKEQRKLLTEETSKGYFFIEYPAPKYRRQGGNENAPDGASVLPHVFVEFFKQEDAGEVLLAKHPSVPDAGYCSQESSKSSPIASPGIASSQSWPKGEQQASASRRQSDGGDTIVHNRRQKTGIYKAKRNILRRLLKRIRSVRLKSPRSGRSLLSMVESPNVSLVSYTRKP